MNAKEKIKKELEEMLVCTFGYMEAEEEILARCLDAIKHKDMSYLKKDLQVFCAGDRKLLDVSETRVCLILHKYGIWDYVKKTIEESEKSENSEE